MAAVTAAAIAAAAWGARALTTTGALAAAAVGTVILGAAGWPGGAVLLAFFVGSSVIGRLLTKPTALDAKGETRDAWQVLANGGAAALGAHLAASHDDPVLGCWLIGAALAAAAADTWATAWGSGSRTPPRHLLTGRVVPPGTSGGITVRGTLGAVAGAATVAAAAVWAVRETGGALADAVGGLAGLARQLGFEAHARTLRPARLFPALLLIGVAGMLLDSALGALLQGRFRCPACDAATEARVHRCGTTTERTGGVTWLTNDGVNALATFGALIAGFACWDWISRS